MHTFAGIEKRAEQAERERDEARKHHSHEYQNRVALEVEVEALRALESCVRDAISGTEHGRLLPSGAVQTILARLDEVRKEKP